MLSVRAMSLGILLVVVTCLALLASGCLTPRTVATASSGPGTVKLETLRWPDWLRGEKRGTLAFEGHEGVRSAQLLDTLFEKAVLVAVHGQLPRVFCLFDFDTSTELIVLETGNTSSRLSRRVRTIVPASELTPRLASQQDILEMRELIERMDDQKLKEAQAPYVDLGVIRWSRGRADVLQALDSVFPMEASGKWGVNARGERRLSEEVFE